MKSAEMDYEGKTSHISQQSATSGKAMEVRCPVCFSNLENPIKYL